MKKGILIAGVAIVVLVGGVVAAERAEAFSFRELISVFVEKGIISADNANKALQMVGIVESIEDEAPLNADKVEVAVSQLIQFSDRIYKEGSDVEGLVFTLTNITDQPIPVEARRQCAVSYKIYDDEDLLYDSGTTEICTSDERVTYVLNSGQVRMFNVDHANDAFHLDPGTYRVVMEYPEYGSGEKEITIIGD